MQYTRLCLALDDVVIHLHDLQFLPLGRNEGTLGRRHSHQRSVHSLRSEVLAQILILIEGTIRETTTRKIVNDFTFLLGHDTLGAVLLINDGPSTEFQRIATLPQRIILVIRIFSATNVVVNGVLLWLHNLVSIEVIANVIVLVVPLQRNVADRVSSLLRNVSQKKDRTSSSEDKSSMYNRFLSSNFNVSSSSFSDSSKSSSSSSSVSS